MKELRVAIGDTWQPKALPYFAMIMMGLMLITDVLNLKFINVHGFSVISSLLSYCFALIIGDILAEVYGYRRVRRLLWTGLSMLVVYAVFVQIAVLWQPATDFTNNAAFVAIFSQTPRIAFASILAFFTGELTNSYIMSRLKVRLTARYFYERALTSVGVAQIVNGATFWLVAFGGVLSLHFILSAATFSWVTVMLTEIIILPLTKKLARFVKEHEGIEHFDARPPVVA